MSSRMHKVCPACLLIALLLLAGCGDSGATDAAEAARRLAWGAPGNGKGKFLSPRVVLAANGRIYVSDKTLRIQVFNADGMWLETWKLEKLNRGFPTGMGAAPGGRIAVADTHNYRVLILDRRGKVIRKIGRQGGGPGEFTYVTDVEFDRDGFMYVSEHGRNDRVQKFDPEGRYVTEWGRTGDDPGEFRRPQALAVDGKGFIYVADCANHRVQKFTRDGEFVSAFGGFGSGPGRFRYPYDLAVGPDDMLFVCEYGGNRVQCFDEDGRWLGIISKAGRQPGELASPWSVTWMDGRGLYVADTGNNRIQLFTLPGDMIKNNRAS